MAITPIHGSSDSKEIRDLLESNYSRTSLVQIGCASSVPLLRNHFWLVVRGIVKLGCITIHGDMVMLGLAGPNELFGDGLAGADAYEAVSLSHCDLLCLPKSELLKSPSLAPALIEAISKRQRQSQAMLALMGLRRVEDRVRGFLELIGLEYGIHSAEGLKLLPKLTHQDIASALGTTRVTVTRILGQLKEQGWLTTDPERSIILKPLPRR